MGAGLGVVARLVDLVTEGVLGSRGTVDVSDDRLMQYHQTHRVPMGALLSLATSLLVSLETPETAPWTVSAT